MTNYITEHQAFHAGYQNRVDKNLELHRLGLATKPKNHAAVFWAWAKQQGNIAAQPSMVEQKTNGRSVKSSAAFRQPHQA